MDINGRYDHIEDVLARLHGGQWFGWSDSKNKVYANLIIHDDTKTKPTEKSLTDALAKQQSDFDANEYQRSRASEYPSIPDQLDEIYHNGIDSWKAVIKKTKDKYPKG
tara:strand:- start:5913 stop:6236 length:324 start_codon:yes stop_codon:yes gene_type:complete